MKLFILVGILCIAQCSARGYYRRPIHRPVSRPVFPQENLPPDVPRMRIRSNRDLPNSLWPSDWLGWFLDRVDKSKQPTHDHHPHYPYHPKDKDWVVFPVHLKRKPDTSDWGVYPNTSYNLHPPCWPFDTRPQCVGRRRSVPGYGR